MSGFRPMPGTRFALDKVSYRVHTYDHLRGCVTIADDDGVLSTVSIEDLVHHPALTLTHQPKSPEDLVSRLPEATRKMALRRIEHVCEAMTGYRSGDARQPVPGEPRPEYDPSKTLQKDRLAAKARELDNEFAREYGVAMSARTIRRLWKQIQSGTAFSVASGVRRPRRGYGRRAIEPEVAEETHRLIADQRGKSSKTVSGLFLELRGRLTDTYGNAWVKKNLPNERTWRRYLGDHWTPSQINGKARTRGSATSAPPGGFHRPNPTRPGQLLLMDTNSLDVLLKGTVLEGAIRGSLVAAMDAFSRSVCALRVVEQSEKNLDVSFTLLDVSRPTQMLPGWPSEARWAYVGIPESVILPDGDRDQTRVAAMPIVNPEALVTDNGTTYRAHKTRELCRRHGIDLLPARAYRGSDKAAMERFFGAVRTMLLEHLDGYRGSDTSERGKSVDNEVEWTAQRLEDLLSLWVVMVWQTHVMSDVKPPWCPEGDWSPNALYLHGMNTSGLAPKVMTAEDFYSAQSTSHVKVQSRGVKIRGLWFDDSVLDDYRNTPAPTALGKWEVNYDTRDLRQVWFVDEHRNRHRLPWVGATGDFPAFGERHLNALRKRLGESITKFTSDYLAEVLLTQVLPVRDADGWVVNGERADADASKTARDLELAARDAAAYDAHPTPVPPPGEPSGALETKRRERRQAATQDAPVQPAPRMNAGSGGMFGSLAALIDGQDETA